MTQRQPYPRVFLPPEDDARDGGLARLALVALAAGAVAGLVGGAFRWCLQEVELFRTTVLEWTQEAPAVRWLVPVLLAAIAVGLARLIVRFVPEASGSGIQRVEANARHEIGYAPFRIVPAKFVGGLLAIGAGLALGREGPTVQMGAIIGARAGRLAKVPDEDERTLSAALAGAGLAVAFSAPIGGAFFTFEEVTRAFRTRLVITTLAASAAAMAVARLIVGSDPVFSVPDISTPPMWTLLLFGGLGVLVGFLGVAYNRLVMAMLDLFDRIRTPPPEIKAAIVGGLVGLLGVIDPRLVGGGDELNQSILVGQFTISALILILVVRWFLGPLSYSLGTPGGLFAPLLVVGASIGAIIAETLNLIAPSLELSPLAFAIVGMSTFFAAVVRAPVTGVVLVVEMTATTSLIVPMILAAAVAVVTTTMLHAQPVYDSLRERLLRRP
ncbi:MAG: H(+)/Cl(-) exchange transporter ClcA [Actinomycetales bacterium]|nr:H(+)/Cl(-) exchange transporter ClcA [Actinomycetales bacterium]